jgi:hypothetical protein
LEPVGDRALFMAWMALAAIGLPNRRLGRRGNQLRRGPVRRPWPCRPMAQEFGDHPDAAASRMRWVRQLAQTAGGGR